MHLAIDVSIETTRATVNNVLAYLPGKTDEYIILGAHYDHLGYGHYDSLAPSQIGQIHPGADDNASGTAGLLELARLLAPLKGQLQRGILFASFAGEELGLLGSAEWVKEPTRPLGQGRRHAEHGHDRPHPRRKGLHRRRRHRLDVPIRSSPAAEKNFQFHIENSAGGYASSDHTSFVAKKIPVLFFFSGLHADYHRPSDTWDKINAPDAARLLDMVAKVALQLDAAPARPAFVTVVANEDPHAGVATSGGAAATDPISARFLISARSENGVRFSDVQPGSPAAKAGLKAGDVLVQFGDKADHESVRFHRRAAQQQGRRGRRSHGHARRQAAEGVGEARSSAASEVFLMSKRKIHRRRTNT